MNDEKKDLALGSYWLCIGILLYCSIALTAYRFAHSELTETQIILHFWDAVLWK